MEHATKINKMSPNGHLQALNCSKAQERLERSPPHLERSPKLLRQYNIIHKEKILHSEVQDLLYFTGTTLPLLEFRMKYPTTHDAIARMRLEQLPSGKWTLMFRTHYALPSSVHGREVPRVMLEGANGAAEDVFYFCGEFALPLKTYYSFFLETYSLSDREAALHSDAQWSSAELASKSYEIQGMSLRGGATVARSSLLSIRDSCVKKMLVGGTTSAEVCALFSISDRYARKLMDPTVETEPEEDKEDKENEYITSDPRYKNMRKLIAYARARASKKEIYGSFSPMDVLPNRNAGRNGSAKFIPQVCPVLRIPLRWGDEGHRMLGGAVVWRKTNTKPFGADNVIVMSKLASWMIEGEYAHSKVSAILDSDSSAHKAWGEWRDKHPFHASYVPSHKPVKVKL